MAFRFFFLFVLLRAVETFFSPRTEGSVVPPGGRETETARDETERRGNSIDLPLVVVAVPLSESVVRV